MLGTRARRNRSFGGIIVVINIIANMTSTALPCSTNVSYTPACPDEDGVQYQMN
jgi:hypothetical protein